MNSKPSVYKVESGPFQKRITVPSSKSYANRLLVLAAISKKDVLVKNLSDSTDVLNMLSAFEVIGLKVEKSSEGTWIKGSFPECEKLSEEIVKIKSGDGGTTNRFLMAFLARGKNTYELDAEEGMRVRPMDELSDSLKSLDVKVEFGGDEFWIRVKGPINSEKKSVKVDTSKSTQFPTALALATADLGIDVIPDGMDSSIKYYELTEHLVSGFKSGSINYNVPVDFSSLSYPLAAGLTLGSVHVENCFSSDSFQADSAFLKIIEDMGGRIELSEDGLKLETPAELKPIDIDGAGYPDLVPTLAYVCSLANGTSYLRNLEVLHYKECDRIIETLKILDAFNIEYHYHSDAEEISITGPSKKVEGSVEFDPPADHRMVMVAYLFMRAHSGGVLSNSHHVKKSFPSFFETMK